MYGIAQGNTAVPPTAFTIAGRDLDPTSYMWGIVQKSTGVVFKVGILVGGKASVALATANANRATWLAGNGWLAANDYTFFITGHSGKQSVRGLSVGDLYSNLSERWETPATGCVKVVTVTSGVIATTAVCS